MSELFMADTIENTFGFEQFQGMFQEIMAMPEDSLTPESMEMFDGIINGIMTDTFRKKSIESTVENSREEGITRSQFKHNVANVKTSFADYIDALKPSPMKRVLLEKVSNIFLSLLDDALAQYNEADFVMNIKLEDGVQEPTYAHDTDAAADLYALEETIVKAHSFGNKIRTGVSIALPEHWMAFILPRSSIGAKTPLRLSNSVGLIDSDYRGELGVLFDNISDSDYTIQAGDRIAQLLVMPSYQFRANVVDTLDETERGNGGFGSTGT